MSLTLFFLSLGRVETAGEGCAAGPSDRGAAAAGGGRGRCVCEVLAGDADNGDEVATRLSSALRAMALCMMRTSQSKYE